MSSFFANFEDFVIEDFNADPKFIMSPKVIVENQANGNFSPNRFVGIQNNEDPETPENSIVSNSNYSDINNTILYNSASNRIFLNQVIF